PVRRVMNTYGVERNNLTVRQHARRLGRKVNAFSKEPDDLEHQLPLAFAYYHFVVPHRRLRQRLPHTLPTKGQKGSRKKWKPVTPAMAAGLTDHVWTMDELTLLVKSQICRTQLGHAIFETQKDRDLAPMKRALA